tara:strand:+ start:309 stop:524 length:216 start_codon:yes stop_codon:yes gene_type:complete
VDIAMPPKTDEKTISGKDALILKNAKSIQTNSFAFSAVNQKASKIAMTKERVRVRKRIDILSETKAAERTC